MKRIALIVDVENWAFYNIAKNIKPFLSKYYKVDIIALDKYDNNLVKLYLIANEYDLIHFFWRGYINYPRDYFFQFYIEKLGGNREDFMKRYVQNAVVTTSVYDHLFLEGQEKEITNYILDNSKSYTVSSQILYNIYRKEFRKKPYGVITDGVSFEQFYPINLERFDNLSDRDIVVGWVGNSEWEAQKEDFKGINTIIKPAIEQLQQEGFPIKMFFADRKEQMIPHDKMVYYYSKIDLYVCSSKIEGTPNPVLESMACGIPIISTRVGIVPEVLGKKQQKYILEERTVECLKEKIKILLKNTSEFKKLSNENLESIKPWSWEIKANQFKEFFEKNIR